ncbi:MAG TPA: GNAT family N-acetyltransferase [Acidimicrobiales bacterium]|nr:GNAT family N-acetyltransferase [Acidimicrobiales bacterium]
MGVEVRTITEDELPAWGVALTRGFMHVSAPEGDAEFRRQMRHNDRNWAAFDGTAIVGTLRSFPTPLTLPGGATVTSAALTAVTVSATHRRQGLLTRMLTGDLDASVERDEPVGILIAAEFPIYGRFGYGSAADHNILKLDVSRTRWLREAEGMVELVDEATARREAPAVYERHRAMQPGSIGRDDRWWDIALRVIPFPAFPISEKFWVLCRDKRGKVVGYCSYSVEDHWVERRPDSTVVVGELVAVDDAAALRMWQYLAQIDWARTVSANDRSVDDPLHWQLVDGRAVRAFERSDFLWVRPLDVPAFLGARRYPVEGKVTLEVVDDLGYASGRFTLEGGPDGATCTKARTRPDIALSASALGAVSLGGTSLSTLARAGQVDEHKAGAVMRADALFRWSRAPWCNTWF